MARALIVIPVTVALATLDHVENVAHAEADPAAPTKAPPAALDPSHRDVASDCTLAAYAALDKELPALRAIHLGDDAAFAKAYAVRKEQLVGAAALRAKGCSPTREE
jgi:hypothetical protein